MAAGGGGEDVAVHLPAVRPACCRCALLHRRRQHLEVLRLADRRHLLDLAVLVELGDEALALVEHAARRTHAVRRPDVETLAECDERAIDGSSVETAEKVIAGLVAQLVHHLQHLADLEVDCGAAVRGEEERLLRLDPVRRGVLLRLVETSLDLRALVRGEVVEPLVGLEVLHERNGGVPVHARDEDRLGPRRTVLRTALHARELGPERLADVLSHAVGDDFAARRGRLRVVLVVLVALDVTDEEDSSLGGHVAPP